MTALLSLDMEYEDDTGSDLWQRREVKQEENHPKRK